MSKQTDMEWANGPMGTGILMLVVIGAIGKGCMSLMEPLVSFVDWIRFVAPIIALFLLKVIGYGVLIFVSWKVAKKLYAHYMWVDYASYELPHRERCINNLKKQIGALDYEKYLLAHEISTLKKQIEELKAIPGVKEAIETDNNNKKLAEALKDTKARSRDENANSTSTAIL